MGKHIDYRKLISIMLYSKDLANYLYDTVATDKKKLFFRELKTSKAVSQPLGYSCYVFLFNDCMHELKSRFTQLSSWICHCSRLL